MDYPFTLIEIRFNKDGIGQGKMSALHRDHDEQGQASHQRSWYHMTEDR